MKRPAKAEAQRAWDRIERLGGHGVWEREMVVVSLAGTGITDDELKLFDDFPEVQILDLSETGVSDAGLDTLANLPALEELILVGTQVGTEAIKRFRARRPKVNVTTNPPASTAINPFTDKLL